MQIEVFECTVECPSHLQIFPFPYFACTHVSYRFPLAATGCRIPLSMATQWQLHRKLITSKEMGSAVSSSCQHRCQGELEGLLK